MTKRKLVHFFKELAIMAVVVVISANLLSIYNARSIDDAPLQIKHLKLLEGTTYNLPKNKPVVLHFWATWCPVCKAEIDNIQRLGEHYEIVTVAVNSDDIKHYLKERHLTLRVVDDSDGVLAQAFGVHAFPTTFIYDGNKNLVFSEVGYTSTLGLWLRLLYAEMQ